LTTPDFITAAHTTENRFDVLVTHVASNEARACGCENKAGRIDLGKAVSQADRPS
jgi:hypothetical protein